MNAAGKAKQKYEACLNMNKNGVISLQPLGREQATVSHMNAKHVSFQLMYGA